MIKTEINVAESIRRVLNEESAAVKNLESAVDDSLVQTVRRLAGCPGRIVVSGIGKSAIIARKIVATMNSTGTPAIFLHAADAVHGDLGMIGRDDIVIVISKSGNTSEIKRIVPIIRKYGNYLIAMVANRESYLATHSDAVIYTPVEREACPNNLAPTVSTAVQLAMGDAVAMSLSRMKGFSEADFGRFHPGGALGKRLYMRVEDVFDKENRPAVPADETVQNTIINISAHRLGATVVLGRDSEVLGIITDGDVRRMVERGGDIQRLKASDIMSSSPKSVDMDSLAVEALEIMEKNSITSLIVRNNGRYAGLVHIHDIMREGIG